MLKTLAGSVFALDLGTLGLSIYIWSRQSHVPPAASQLVIMEMREDGNDDEINDDFFPLVQE